MPSFVIPVVVAVVIIAVAIVLFKLMWRVAEPNEALIISGLSSGKSSNDEESQFRVVTGKGCFVIPGVQAVRRLKLNLHESALHVECVTQQGIPVSVDGVVIYKIADDLASIANAARRFLGQQDVMDHQVHSVFAGHLRAIIGGLTVEQLISDRDALESATREGSASEMTKLGFLLDSLKIQEIDDPTGYIQNLAKPHIAQVQRSARIAEATNNQAAAESEAAASAEIAAAQRASAIKQAGYTAEVQQAQAKAAQAGPLAEAQAQQDVVRQQTAVAELEAERTERQLDATVRKPADAANYQHIKQAEANRQATILGAQAEAERVKLSAGAQAAQTQQIGLAEGASIAARGQAEAAVAAAKGEAEGRALKARAEGLAANQDAVIGQQIASQVPEIVRAAASAFGNVENMTVLNGAEGVMDALNVVIAQGMNSLKTIRSALSDGTNGTTQITLSEEAERLIGSKH